MGTRVYTYVIVKIPPKWYSVPGGGPSYVADSILQRYPQRQL
jgi:hypothetical protein